MLLILTIGRSGSSMVSGIFAKHGLWAGDLKKADQWNKRGYFENMELREALKRRFGWPPRFIPELHPEWRAEVHRIIRSQGWNGQPWMFKCGVSYWRVWEDFKPVVVKVHRPIEDVMASYRRSNKLPNPDRENLVRWQVPLLSSVPGFNVDAVQVSRGDFSSLRAPMDAMGITFREQIARDFVDQSLFMAST